MTVELEKIFFNYIYKNKQYIEHVDGSFFRNPDICLIYSSLKKYIIDNSTAEIPSKQQLFMLVNGIDKESKISKPFIKALLSTELDNFDEIHYIIPELEAWIISNRVQKGASEIIDLTRTLEVTNDKNKIRLISEQIKTIITESTNNNFLNTEDLGSDFDDAEEHSQDHSVTKITTGFKMLDELTGGGFDRGTFISAMAKTNAGKSIFMQNLSAKVADQGYNVVYFTLEMSEKKVLKRIGSMRLKIPINSYDKLSIDTDYIKERIDSLKLSSDGLFEQNENIFQQVLQHLLI